MCEFIASPALRRFNQLLLTTALTALSASLGSQPALADAAVPNGRIGGMPIEQMNQVDALGRRLVRQCVIINCLGAKRGNFEGFRYGTEEPDGSVVWFQDAKPGLKVEPRPAHDRPVESLTQRDPFGGNLVRQCLFEPCTDPSFGDLPTDGHYRYGTKSARGRITWFETSVTTTGEGHKVVEVDPAGRRVFKQLIAPSNPDRTDGYTLYGSEDHGVIKWHNRVGGRYLPGKIKGNPTEPLPRNRSLMIVSPPPPPPTPTSGTNVWSKDEFTPGRAGGGPELHDTKTKDPFGHAIFERYRTDAMSRRLGKVERGVLDASGKFRAFDAQGPQYRPIPAAQAPTVPSDSPMANYIDHVLRNRAAWRPSLLEQTVQGLKGVPGSAYDGWRSLWDPKNGEPFNNPVSRLKSAQQYTGFASFYVAMGILAAYKNLKDAPNNPVAWDRYTKSLTDTQGWMMTAGFMGVMYPFMSKMRGFETAGGVVRSIPAFTQGMLFALGGQFLIMELTDKDNLQCIADWTVRAGGSRDLGACDRAFEKFTAENLSLQWGPIIANTMTTTGLFLGINLGSSLIGVPRILASLPYMNTLRGNIAGMIASTLLFVYLQDQTDISFAVNTKMLAMQLTDWPIAQNVYGGGISANEAYLYATWTKFKGRGLVDVPKAQDVDIDPTCQAAAKNVDEATALERGLGAGVLPPQCYVNRSLDMHGVLERYAQLHATWRSKVAFARSDAAFRAWMAKIAEYHTTINLAYEYYDNFVNRIIAEQKNPKMATDDPKGFNPPGLMLEQQQLDAILEATQSSLPDTTHVWKYVRTKPYLSFLVASMACGPEAEGYFVQEPDGNWTKIKHAVEEYAPSIIGDRFKDHSRVITNAPGLPARFFPPRLVARIAGQDGSVCDAPPVGNALNMITTAMDFTPSEFSVNQRSWFGFGSGAEYRNLYEFTKRNLRAGIIVNGENHFKEWWIKNLAPAIVQTEAQFREEYVQMLEHTYREDLNRSTDYHCDLTPSADSSLTFVMSALAPLSGTPCPANALHVLSKGVWAGMHDELRLYLSLLIDQEFTLAQSDAAKLNAGLIRGRALDVLNAFDQRIATLAAQPDGLKRTHDDQKAVIKNAAANMQTALLALMTSLAPSHQELYDDLECDRGTVTQALFCRINALNKEGLIYNEVVGYVYAEPASSIQEPVKPAEAPVQTGSAALSR